MPESVLLYKPVNGAAPAGATEILRTPDTFLKIAVTAAGQTAVWTPAAGHRFRLMGFIITLSDDATLAVAGETTLTLQDAAAAIHAFDFWLPSVAITTALGICPPIVVNLPQNGYLSSAINQALNANLSTALATGKFRVNAWGAEELS